jgi:trimeric autotransporter adhesin
MVELVVRDFLADWYMTNASGGGISSDPSWLDYTRTSIAHVFGNLLYRIFHVNPLSLVLDDATEAVRIHLGWYGAMLRRAEAEVPEAFASYSDEQLLSRAAARRLAGGGTVAASASASASSSALPSLAVVESAGAQAPASPPLVSSAGSSAAAAAETSTGSGASTAARTFTPAERDLVAAERRYLEERRERAVVAAYAASPGVLHPSCAVLDTPLLEAEPSPTSWPVAGCGKVVPGQGPTPALAAELAYLRPICAQLVLRLLPPSERGSVVQNVLLREILTTLVFQPLLSMLEPDEVNFELLFYLNKGAGTPATTIVPPATPSHAIEAVRDVSLEGGPGADVRVLRSPALRLPLHVFRRDFDDAGAQSRAKALAAAAARAAEVGTAAGTGAAATPATPSGGGVGGAALAAGPSPTAPGTPGATSAADSGAGVSNGAGQLHDLGYRYFAGPISRDDAETILAGQPVGSFLIRNKPNGTLLLSYVRAVVRGAVGGGGIGGGGGGGGGTPQTPSLLVAAGPGASSATATPAFGASNPGSGMPSLALPVAASAAASASAAGAIVPGAASSVPSSTLPSSAILLPSPLVAQVAHVKIESEDHRYVTPRGKVETLAAYLRSVRDKAWLGCVVEAKSAQAAAPSLAPADPLLLRFDLLLETLYADDAGVTGSVPPAVLDAVLRRAKLLALAEAASSGLGSAVGAAAGGLVPSTPAGTGNGGFSAARAQPGLFSSLSPVLNKALRKQAKKARQQLPRGNGAGGENGTGVVVGTPAAARTGSGAAGGDDWSFSLFGSSLKRKGSRTDGLASGAEAAGTTATTTPAAPASSVPAGETNDFGSDDEREADEEWLRDGAGDDSSSTSSDSDGGGGADGASATSSDDDEDGEEENDGEADGDGDADGGAAGEELDAEEEEAEDGDGPTGSLSSSIAAARAKSSDLERESGGAAAKLLVAEEASRGAPLLVSTTTPGFLAPVAIPPSLPTPSLPRTSSLTLDDAAEEMFASSNPSLTPAPARPTTILPTGGAAASALAARTGTPALRISAGARDGAGVGGGAAAAKASAVSFSTQPSSAATPSPPSAADFQGGFAGLRAALFPSLAQVAQAAKAAAKAGGPGSAGAAGLIRGASFSSDSGSTGSLAALAGAAKPAPSLTSMVKAAGVARMLAGRIKEKRAAAEAGGAGADSLLLSTPRGSMSEGSAVSVASFLPVTPPVDEHRLSARVTRYSVQIANQASFDSQAVVRYVLVVTFGPARWHVRARYSEFRDVHQQVKDCVPDFVGKFPPKEPFRLGGRFDADFIEGRRVALDAWTQTLLANPLARDTYEVRRFLSPRHANSVVIEQAPARSNLKGSGTPGAAGGALRGVDGDGDGADGDGADGGGNDTPGADSVETGEGGALQTGGGDDGEGAGRGGVPAQSSSSSASSSASAAAAGEGGPSAGTPSSSSASAASSAGDGTSSSSSSSAAAAAAAFAAATAAGGAKQVRFAEEGADGLRRRAVGGSAGRGGLRSGNEGGGSSAIRTSASSSSSRRRTGGSSRGGPSSSSSSSSSAAGIASGSSSSSSSSTSLSSSSSASSAAAAIAAARRQGLAFPLLLTPMELQRSEARFFALVSEVFDLESSGWLRRQAVGATRTLLKLLYHGTAANKVAAAYQNAISVTSVAGQLHHLAHNVLWPGGVLRTSQPARSWAEQRASREEARAALLLALTPTALTSLLGRDAAEGGIVKLHDFLQIPVLVRSLTYTLFDLLLARVFPAGDWGRLALHGLPPPPPPPPAAAKPSEGLVDAMTGAVPAVLNAGGQLARVMADAGMAALRSGVPAMTAVFSGMGGAFAAIGEAAVAAATAATTGTSGRAAAAAAAASAASAASAAAAATATAAAVTVAQPAPAVVTAVLSAPASGGGQERAVPRGLQLDARSPRSPRSAGVGPDPRRSVSRTRTRTPGPAGVGGVRGDGPRG